MSRELLKVEIKEGKERIAQLEQQVADAQAKTADAMRAVNVQTRYASRVQSVARQAAPPRAGFMERLHDLIDADKATLQARGK